MSWWKNIEGKIRFREPLKDKTTFKIGGAADFFIQPKDFSDLKRALLVAGKNKIAFFILGAGSNLLVSDKGLKGAVLKLDSAPFKKIAKKGENCISVGSGLPLAKLISWAGQHNFSGVEFLSGIPGTVGGALAMNAACWGRSIGDLIEKINVMSYNGKTKILQKKDLRFGYRSSNLSGFVILSATLKLTRKSKEEIRKNINHYLKERRESQDSSFPNAGCIFKNPLPESAGRLIDLCGLKGKSYGGASISLRHANFILNHKNAKAGDVIKLMELAKDKVKNKFDIVLEPEIKIWR